MIDIAFLLEQPVKELVSKWIEEDSSKYHMEHEANYAFYHSLVDSENAKFDALLDAWNERLRQFHILKQNFALESYIDRVNSFEFMNPKSRVKLFLSLKEEQVRIY